MTAQSSDEEMAMAISNYANSHGGSSFEKVGAAMANDHPTLQQGMMRLFVAFVREMAKKPYADLRNQASVDLAKGLVKEWGEYGPYLPFV
jgi:hypothetical protein